MSERNGFDVEKLPLETPSGSVLEERLLAPLSTLDRAPTTGVNGQAPLPDASLPSQTPVLSATRTAMLAGLMMMTYFLGAGSVNSVALLVPTMAGYLGETELQTQWIVSAYPLIYSCGLLFSGRLADIYSRKLLYMSGLSIYAVFAIVTGVVKQRLSLCVTRALCGLGMAIASPAGFGIIGINIRHEPARTIAFAVAGLGNPIGSGFGILLGGVMATIGGGGWSYLFFLLAGVATVLAVLAFFVIPPDPRNQEKALIDRRIDWLGGGIVTAAICLFTFSLIESGIALNGWRSPHVPALFVTSIVLFILFTIWSLHLEHRTSYPPIIKISLLHRRHGLISLTCASVFSMQVCGLAWVYTSAIFYQKYKGMTPWQNAKYTITTTCVGVFAAGAVLCLAPRVRAPYLIGVGSVMSAGCSIMYAVWPEGTNFWALEFPAQLVHPWGIDFVFGLGAIMISNVVNDDEQSIGGALFQTSAQVGAALGVCLSALVSSAIRDQSDDLLTGVRAGFWFSASTGLLVTVIGLIGFRKVRLAKDVGRIVD